MLIIEGSDHQYNSLNPFQMQHAQYLNSPVVSVSADIKIECVWSEIFRNHTCAEGRKYINALDSR